METTPQGPTTTRKYLLIHGRLYLAANLDTPLMKHGNLYPGALGEWCGQDSLLPAGTVRAANGETVALFGRRYEVNDLRRPDTEPDEIDLELVLLADDDDPESHAYDDYLTSLGSHIDPTPEV